MLNGLDVLNGFDGFDGFDVLNVFGVFDGFDVLDRTGDVTWMGQGDAGE